MNPAASLSASRIERDVTALAHLTATPSAGASRPTFSTAWRQARDYVERELLDIGCQVRVDAAGNLHARPAWLAWDAPAWLSGSHLDTVPHGGNYDGVAGVLAPLEILRAANESGRRDTPLELVAFAEEEGTTFGLGMLGSRAWVGQLSADRLTTLRNADGVDYLTAGRPHGIDVEHLATDRLRPDAYLGFVEIHIEQGPGLWNAGRSVAVVRAIAGRRQYSCSVTGVANHAGSTSMTDRRDALAGAAEVVTRLESLAGEISPQAVITVGRIACRPNAVNVIPEAVELTIDFRAPDDGQLAAGDPSIRELIGAIAARRRLTHSLTPTEHQPVVSLDAKLCQRLVAAADALGVGPLPTTVSGALHDSAIVAPYVPTAMLFVASRGGISHHPDEFSRVEDIATAARILWHAIQA